MMKQWPERLGVSEMICEMMFLWFEVFNNLYRYFKKIPIKHDRICRQNSQCLCMWPFVGKWEVGVWEEWGMESSTGPGKRSMCIEGGGECFLCVCCPKVYSLLWFSGPAGGILLTTRYTRDEGPMLSTNRSYQDTGREARALTHTGRAADDARFYLYDPLGIHSVK